MNPTGEHCHIPLDGQIKDLLTILARDSSVEHAIRKASLEQILQTTKELLNEFGSVMQLEVLPMQLEVLPMQLEVLPMQLEVLPMQLKVLPMQLEVLPMQPSNPINELDIAVSSLIELGNSKTDKNYSKSLMLLINIPDIINTNFLVSFEVMEEKMAILTNYIISGKAIDIAIALNTSNFRKQIDKKNIINYGGKKISGLDQLFSTIDHQKLLHMIIIFVHIVPKFPQTLDVNMLLATLCDMLDEESPDTKEFYLVKSLIKIDDPLIIVFLNVIHVIINETALLRFFKKFDMCQSVIVTLIQIVICGYLDIPFNARKWTKGSSGHYSDHEIALLLFRTVWGGNKKRLFKIQVDDNSSTNTSKKKTKIFPRITTI
jgi:hypothetical protein